MTTSLPTSGDTFSLLPPSVRPLHYDLTLIPELETATFAGTVRVELEILNPVLEIVLNAMEVRVQGGQLRIDGEDEPRTFDDIVVDEKAETLTLTFDGGPLPAGKAYLNLSFTGILNDQLHGFYLSTYQAQDGSTRRMA
ncbi:MAG: hypothetical protein O3B84_00380, partial [Chloroflexi bacterium]|nr:hypothetical protein [Chloroflexota bacterium]